MNKFVRNIFFVIIMYAMIFACVNIYLGAGGQGRKNREYENAVSRTVKQIEAFEGKYGRAVSDIDELSAYIGEAEDGIIAIYAAGEEFSAEEKVRELSRIEGDNYKIVSTENNCYRIDYEIQAGVSPEFIFVINMVLFGTFAVSIFVLLYVYQRIIKQFHAISKLPYELSKGNLAVPLKEENNKLFGQFVWGLDLLREKLEDNRKNELAFHREKKLLLISLSHDLKTPLSAIKLYSTALSRDLYKDEEKRREIAYNIGKKADEIESYVSDIVKASKEEFLKFEVHISECYIKEIVDNIEGYYREKLNREMIDFTVSGYTNSLISCDKDRLIEVLQNLMENAIKYGDGKRISIEIKREGDEVHFLVTNTGCTLSKKELPHVFDSFFRGSNVDTKPGSGLGLYICRELIRLMQGEIFAAITEKDEICVDVVVRLA